MTYLNKTMDFPVPPAYSPPASLAWAPPPTHLPHGARIVLRPATNPNFHLTTTHDRHVVVSHSPAVWCIQHTNGGEYVILRHEVSGRVLDVPGGSIACGTVLMTWEHNGGANQLFAFERVEGKQGVCLLRAKGSGMVVDLRVAEGDAVQWVFNGGRNQEWIVQIV
ncbi:hypothetical protein BDK51DRAFT_37263 [Blyttiomyces helicus]|uniref:Ricin B lectin domain-containing protein n=1 Tax=Blyttiomyces helicus TaxID=388810 RepID=A0A4P9WBC3_9FUNG|nr:hypothetical protein BDK51DRAFT_37263 [Blyttiomyces helicus]|eukprot:RKO88895.1 hypothetical protein BDK51DRAFT_37263 [Blyttiomyces helicus]